MIGYSRSSLLGHMGSLILNLQMTWVLTGICCGVFNMSAPDTIL